MMRRSGTTLLRTLVVAATLCAGAAEARAQPVTTLEGGLVAGHPAALPTGLTVGAGLGVTRGCVVAWGARVSWSTATESTLAWQVRNDDVRVRGFAALRQSVGRGVLALRLGVGSTLVYERRSRTQGARAGLTGDALRTEAWAVLPAIDLEGVVQLKLLDHWSLLVSGGPSFVLVHSRAEAGWTSSIGVGWEP